MIYEAYICAENSRDKQTGTVTRQKHAGTGMHGVGNMGKQWEDIQDNKS